ncbi:MAG: hypothetical protein ACI9D5_002433 [Candidatus Endobugula sp.]|jgi:hypothetical protein
MFNVKINQIPIKLCLLLSLLLVILMLNACSSTKYTLKMLGVGSDNAIKNITLVSFPDSNMNSPVAIDLLFVNDDSISPLLLGLSGSEWFNDKALLLSRYGKALDVVSLEVVPLSFVESVDLPKTKKLAQRVLMFTNYRSRNGQFVADISQYKSLTIRLLFDTYELIEMSE